MRHLPRPLFHNAISAIAMVLLPTMAIAQAPARPLPAPAASAPATLAQPAPAVPPAGTANAGYLIGPDDEVDVDLLGQADFRTRTRVRADGTIQLPLLGSIPVTGRTPVTLGEDIAARLRSGGFYAKPIVDVRLVSYASRYVIVLGDVGTPGLLPVDRTYRVSEVIARSGGIRETGADYVILRRVTGEELRLPFAMLAAGSLAEDPQVQAGDKIYVPAAETFYIYGQVNAPGAYPIKDQLTLRKALARGGGLTQSGSEKRVKLYRGGIEQKKFTMDQPILAGDVVVVGERMF